MLMIVFGGCGCCVWEFVEKTRSITTCLHQHHQLLKLGAKKTYKIKGKMEQMPTLEPSALNDVEQSTKQLQKLKEWLRTTDLSLSTSPNHTSTIDDEYNNKLKQGISIRKKHLKVAKDILIDQQLRLQREQELDGTSYGVKEQMNGVYYTNDRVPYHVERGDSIGVSLGNVRMHSQVQQSKEVVQVLETRLSLLKERTGVQMENREKLRMLVDLLQKRIQNETKRVVKESEVDQMERLVQEEMLRSRKLKGYLKEMRREYE